MTVRTGDFEWDEAKAIANARKHGVTFEEATEVFADPMAQVYADSAYVDRSVIIRYSLSRLLTVVYVERNGDGTIRIISARRATKTERKAYDEEA